jgi:hypothetical protein
VSQEVEDTSLGTSRMFREIVGVTDFTQEPTDHFSETDMGVRDPFGNSVRILQQGKVAQPATA